MTSHARKSFRRPFRNDRLFAVSSCHQYSPSVPTITNVYQQHEPGTQYTQTILGIIKRKVVEEERSYCFLDPTIPRPWGPPRFSAYPVKDDWAIG